jgi:hypothetical protein
LLNKAVHFLSGGNNSLRKADHLHNTIAILKNAKLLALAQKIKDLNIEIKCR